jgi:hypothetical protein
MRRESPGNALPRAGSFDVRFIVPFGSIDHLAASLNLNFPSTDEIVEGFSGS